jgi:hypothetical protein
MSKISVSYESLERRQGVSDSPDRKRNSIVYEATTTQQRTKLLPAHCLLMLACPHKRDEHEISKEGVDDSSGVGGATITTAMYAAVPVLVGWSSLTTSFNRTITVPTTGSGLWDSNNCTCVFGISLPSNTAASSFCIERQAENAV